MNLFSIEECAQIVSEGFVLKDGIFYFDSTSDSYLGSEYGQGKLKPYSMSISGGVAYSAYKKDQTIPKEDFNDLLYALKGKGQCRVDQKSYNDFIKRTALYFYRLVKGKDIDLILLMPTSSPLVSDIVNTLLQYYPSYFKTVTFNKEIIKNPDLSAITIDSEQYKLSDSTLKSLQSAIDKMKESGYFEIKHIIPQLRKTVHNYLLAKDTILGKLIDANVLIVDDYITSGETLKEASRLLMNSGAKSVTALTLLKQ